MLYIKNSEELVNVLHRITFHTLYQPASLLYLTNGHKKQSVVYFILISNGNLLIRKHLPFIDRTTRFISVKYFFFNSVAIKRYHLPSDGQTTFYLSTVFLFWDVLVTGEQLPAALPSSLIFVNMARVPAIVLSILN